MATYNQKKRGKAASSEKSSQKTVVSPDYTVDDAIERGQDKPRGDSVEEKIVRKLTSQEESANSTAAASEARKKLGDIVTAAREEEVPAAPAVKASFDAVTPTIEPTRQDLYGDMSDRIPKKAAVQPKKEGILKKLFADRSSEVTARDAQSIMALNDRYTDLCDRNLRTRRMLSIVLLCLIGVAVILFAVAALIYVTRGFTVQVMGGSEGRIAISTESSVLNGTTELHSKEVPKGYDLSYSRFASNDLGSFAEIDGSPALQDNPYFFAYTFYVRNTSDVQVRYRFKITMSNATNNVERAIRVVLGYDTVRQNVAGNRRDFMVAALPKTDPNGLWLTDNRGNFIMDKLVDREGVEFDESRQDNPAPFVDPYTPFNLENIPLTPGGVMKYTIIIYFEGGDPDCTNDILGGTAQFRAELSIMTTDEG